jgi:signal transduction histidine kinase
MESILKRTRIDKQIWYGYTIALFLLLTAFAITLYGNRELLKRSGMVEHTNKVIATLELMVSELKNAETDVQAFIITKDKKFLTPYYKSRQIVDSLHVALITLTSNNSNRREQLQKIKEKSDARFLYSANSIKLFTTEQYIVSDSLITRRKISNEDLHILFENIALLQLEESDTLTNRDKSLKKTFSSITIITIISVLLAFVLIVFGILAYRRENTVRKKVIKEIAKYEKQLKNRIDELNNANKELIQMKSQEKFAATGRIARTIAHEVRNPLTNINLAVDQLKSEGLVQEDETSTLLFTMIKRNSNRINQLISDLLNSTKFSELTITTIPVNDLLDETLKEASDRISLTNTRVQKKYTALNSVAVDKGKMKIALLNIIINALEAMGDKEGSVLTIETSEDHKQCKIVISDNGVGMEKQLHNRLFEPYFTTKPKGNGLGLTNTQNIILNHRGYITAETIEGEGMTFTILLDIAS